MSPSYPRLAKRQDPSGTSAEASPTSQSETSNEPTPTPTPSSTPAPTSSQPQTSATPTTPTASATPTPTPTPSQTASRTLSLESDTPSQSETPSATPSPSQTPTPSETPTPSQTASVSQSQAPETVTPSQSPSQSASQPASETPTAASSEAQATQPSQSPTSQAEQTSRAVVTVTSRQSPTQLPVSTRRADTTAESSFFITFTQSDGQLTTAAPSEITSLVATTRPDGGTASVTQIIAQPTGGLNPDGGGRGSSAFFQNKGAVAGVFLIVGIAGAAILAFLLLAYRRRRKYKQHERDAVVAASLGPQNRVPFEDDDDDVPTNNSHVMSQRNPFAYAAGTPHAIGQHGEYVGAGKGSYEPYDPYASYPVPTASSSGHHHSTVHTRVGSGGLDGFEYDYRHYQPPSATGAMPDPRTSPTSPRRAMSPTSGSSQAPTYAPGLGPAMTAAAGPSGQNKRESAADSSSIYSVPEGSLVDMDEDDQRLNSDMLGMRLRGGVGSSGSLRDEEDYSRKVLTVTNAT